MSPEELNREPNLPHTGVMGEPEYEPVAQAPQEVTYEPKPREPVYTVRPSWELLWAALIAVVASVAVAIGALSDGELRNWSVVGGVILVAAIRGLVGWVLQTMTKPRDNA